MPDVPGMGYASFPADDEQIQKRRELSDELLLFVNNAFGPDEGGPGETEAPSPPNVPGQTTKPGDETDEPPEEATEPPSIPANSNGDMPQYLLLGGLGALILIIVIAILQKRKKQDIEHTCGKTRPYALLL
jgi:hypothetical protein